MVYLVEDGKISRMKDDKFDLSKRYVGIIHSNQIEKLKDLFQIDHNILNNCHEKSSQKYESHEDVDYICLHVLNYKNIIENPSMIHIYLFETKLLILCDDELLTDKLTDRIYSEDTDDMSFSKILYMVFNFISVEDMDYLEQIEMDISELEGLLITEKKKDYVHEIITFRKKLMVLKKHYEQLLDVLDSVEENEKNIIDNKTMRYFKIFDAKVDRLYHNVINLRDYVTQVREAYQAEVDISLNNIMKIFTVITAVFMPLTLIVGWYGMNLAMPEYKWQYGYPTVIGLSISVVIICMIYFKKKKWF